MSRYLENFRVDPCPLSYPEINNINKFTNVLLIDKHVKNYQMFVDSANSTTFPIVYSVTSAKTEMLEFILFM